MRHDELADLSPERIADIRIRGCVLVRGTFEREQAVAWNDELAAYLAANDYFDQLAEHEPERAAQGSGISPIFWSKPQIAARQHDRMVEVRRSRSTCGDSLHHERNVLRRASPGIGSRDRPVSIAAWP
jgi:hypothetical protein